jgi:hypothetical protein
MPFLADGIVAPLFHLHPGAIALHPRLPREDADGDHPVFDLAVNLLDHGLTSSYVNSNIWCM